MQNNFITNKDNSIITQNNITVEYDATQKLGIIVIGGRRFEVEIIKNSHNFELAEDKCLKVAQKIAVILAKKNLLASNSALNVNLNNRGIKKYDTNELISHDIKNPKKTRKEYDSLIQFLNEGEKEPTESNSSQPLSTESQSSKVQEGEAPEIDQGSSRDNDSESLSFHSADSDEFFSDQNDGNGIRDESVDRNDLGSSLDENLNESSSANFESFDSSSDESSSASFESFDSSSNESSSANFESFDSSSDESSSVSFESFDSSSDESSSASFEPFDSSSDESSSASFESFDSSSDESSSASFESFDSSSDESSSVSFESFDSSSDESSSASFESVDSSSNESSSASFESVDSSSNESSSVSFESVDSSSDESSSASFESVDSSSDESSLADFQSVDSSSNESSSASFESVDSSSNESSSASFESVDSSSDESSSTSFESVDSSSDESSPASFGVSSDNETSTARSSMSQYTDESSSSSDDTDTTSSSTFRYDTRSESSESRQVQPSPKRNIDESYFDDADDSTNQSNFTQASISSESSLDEEMNENESEELLEGLKFKVREVPIELEQDFATPLSSRQLSLDQQINRSVSENRLALPLRAKNKQDNQVEVGSVAKNHQYMIENAATFLRLLEQQQLSLSRDENQPTAEVLNDDGSVAALIQGQKVPHQPFTSRETSLIIDAIVLNYFSTNISQNTPSRLVNTSSSALPRVNYLTAPQQLPAPQSDLNFLQPSPPRMTQPSEKAAIERLALTQPVALERNIYQLRIPETNTPNLLNLPKLEEKVKKAQKAEENRSTQMVIHPTYAASYPTVDQIAQNVIRNLAHHAAKPPISPIVEVLRENDSVEEEIPSQHTEQEKLNHVVDDIFYRMMFNPLQPAQTSLPASNFALSLKNPLLMRAYPVNSLFLGRFNAERSIPSSFQQANSRPNYSPQSPAFAPQKKDQESVDETPLSLGVEENPTKLQSTVNTIGSVFNAIGQFLLPNVDFQGPQLIPSKTNYGFKPMNPSHAFSRFQSFDRSAPQDSVVEEKSVPPEEPEENQPEENQYPLLNRFVEDFGTAIQRTSNQDYV